MLQTRAVEGCNEALLAKATEAGGAAHQQAAGPPLQMILSRITSCRGSSALLVDPASACRPLVRLHAVTDRYTEASLQGAARSTMAASAGTHR